MKKIFFNFIRIVFSFLMIVGCFFDQTEATTITFDLNYEFSGATSPSGTGPWLVATFTDVSGGVELTLTSLLNSATEFVGNNNNKKNNKKSKGWYFNFDPTLDLNSLLFTVQPGGTAAASINTGANAFKADGDGYYDILFTWNAHDFGMGDSVTYLITSTDTESILASSFNFFSTLDDGNGTYLSAAHIQGIDTTGKNSRCDGSGWIASTVASVPEPATLLLLGIGLLGLGVYGLYGRRKSRNKEKGNLSK